MRKASRSVALLAMAATPWVNGNATAADRPNAVFILADDLGWTDLACYGSGFYETPNIDRLAAQGMRFTNGYSSGPNCSPTRAALMSGQYAPRTGVYTVGSVNLFDWSARPLVPAPNVPQLPLDKITLAQTLKSAGYATGIFGKWHLGDDAAHHPSQRGFDEAITSSGKHFDFVTIPKVEYPSGTYLADFLTDHAVDFITRHKDEPFFLYVPHFGVHSPHQAKEDLTARFEGRPPVGGHHDAVYAAMIASVDESVGRIVDTLEKLDLSENTLVIFSADNGGVGGYKAAGIDRAGSVTDNAPLRGGKGMLYEGGTRVAYIFRWPGKIDAGSECDEPIISVDLYPTLLELTGSARPEGYALDGQSYLPVLTSGGQATLGTRPLYWHFPGYLGVSVNSPRPVPAGSNPWRATPAGAIRLGDYKLIEFFEDNHIELYDLAKDLSQTTDLTASMPEKAQELRDMLHAWRQELNAPMPTPAGEAGAPAAKAKAKAKGKGAKKKKNKAAQDE